MTKWVARLFTVLTSWIEPNLRFFLSSRQILLWSLAIAIGFSTAGAAVLFREAIGLFQWPWLGSRTENVATIAAGLPWWVVFSAPVGGGLLVGLYLQFVMDGRRPGAVADVIEAKTFGGRILGLRHGFNSAFVTALSLGCGGSAGREGPIVHLGGTVGAAFSRMLLLPENARRILIACGVAAAISTSFNAPIAGVLFAHEVILAHYAVSAFVPVVIASTAGAIVSRMYFGDAAAFTLPDHHLASFWEFPAIALLGITCAAVAHTYRRHRCTAAAPTAATRRWRSSSVTWRSAPATNLGP